MNTKYIHHILHTSFFTLFLCPLVSAPGKNLCYALHFFKYILMAQKGFILALQACKFWALMKLTLLHRCYTLCLSPYFPNIQQLTEQCIILYSYIDGLFQYFSFSIIFFPSTASYSLLRQTH
jgi:hypothetical protein